MDERTQFLVDAVRDAADLALSYYGRKDLHTWYKQANSIVTEADGAVQALLVERIRSAFPQALFLGEEDELVPESSSDDRLLFAIDPIDGTSSFSRRLPGWNVSVGVLRGSRPVAGVVYAPLWNELYVAPFEGQEAFFNGEVLPQVEPHERMDAHCSFACDSKMLQVLRTNFPGKIRSFGSCALHFVLAARGAVCFAQSNPVHLWDIAAAVAVGLRVGLKFVHLSGKELEFSYMLTGKRASDVIFAAHPQDLPAILSMFERR